MEFGCVIRDAGSHVVLDILQWHDRLATFATRQVGVGSRVERLLTVNGVASFVDAMRCRFKVIHRLVKCVAHEVACDVIPGHVARASVGGTLHAQHYMQSACDVRDYVVSVLLNPGFELNRPREGR